MNFDTLSWSLFGEQVVIATLVALGFICIQRYLWTRAFSIDQQHAAWFRLALVIWPLALSAFFVFGSVDATHGSTMLMNIAMFIVIISLFDQQITKGELLVRLVGLAGVVILPQPTYWLPLALLALVVILGVAFGVRVAFAEARVGVWTMLLESWVLATTLWLVLPKNLGSFDTTIRLVEQATLMFAAMALAAAFYHYHQQYVRLLAYDDMVNTAAFEAAIEAQFKAARLHREPLSIASIDVDHVRKINQQYGHVVGNAVLMQIGALLRNVLEDYGQPHLYRIGGEEFNVVFDQTPPQATIDALIACLQAVRQKNFNYRDQVIKCHISIGVAGMRDFDQSLDELYKRVDDSLFQSKHRGCDTITIEGKPVTQPGRTAPNYAFFAQPIMQVGNTTSNWSNELLLRYQDSLQNRWVLPERFDLPVQQQVDLIERAIKKLPHQDVAINLTLSQFSDPQTAEALIACCQRSDGPKQLTVEIVDVPDSLTTRRISAMYRSAGIRIHIDDVGSDNSYELVRELLPYVDGVKFAMQNLRKTDTLAQIQKRIRFWAGVAQQHHLTLILEGVENQADVLFAQTLGINYFQGYYFAKPALPAA